MGTISVFLHGVEITAETFAVDVRRGRSLENEDFAPGGGTIRVRNYFANFNPYFLAETFALLQGNDDYLLQADGSKILLGSGNGTGVGQYGDIRLGRSVTVVDGAVTVFSGFVEDFDFTYQTDGTAEAVLTVRDALASLGSTDLREWTTTDGQMTGTRVAAVLDRPEVGFPTGGAARDIDTGTQPLGSSTISLGTNALQELQRINRAEYGRLFVDAAGRLVFQDRYAAFGVAPSAMFGGGNLPIGGIDIRFGTELLHFAVSVSRDGGETEQYVENAGLIDEYTNLGVRHLSLSNLPLRTDGHARALAQLTLRRFSSFAAVFSGLQVKLGALDPTDRATVTGLDIGDTVVVSWTPTGTTGVVTQTVAIEAVSYTTSGNPDDAVISFQLSDASDPDYFVVNTDSVNGVAVLAP